MFCARIALFVCASGGCFAQYPDAATKNSLESTPQALNLLHQGSLADTDGRFLQAASYYERAAAMLEHSRGPNDNATLTALHRLADAFMNLGRYAKAERLLRRVVLAREAMLDADPALTARALNDLALVCLAQHQPQKAEPLIGRAVAIFERQPLGHEVDLASALNTMAWAMARPGRRLEAIAYAQRAQTLLDAVNAPAQDRIENLSTLAALYAGAGRLDEAADYARRIIETTEAAFGPAHFRTALALRLYAAVLHRQKLTKEAKEKEQQAAKILMEIGISPAATVDITALRGAAR
jgi:tetratricopeptide (TPR) repeat protein